MAGVKELTNISGIRPGYKLQSLHVLDVPRWKVLCS